MKFQNMLLVSASLVMLAQQEAYGGGGCGCFGGGDDSTAEPYKQQLSGKTLQKINSGKGPGALVDPKQVVPTLHEGTEGIKMDLPPHLRRRHSSLVRPGMTLADQRRISRVVDQLTSDDEVSSLDRAVASIFEKIKTVQSILPEGELRSHLLEALVNVPQTDRISVVLRSSPWMQLLSVVAVNPSSRETLQSFLRSLTRIEIIGEGDDETEEQRPFMGTAEQKVVDSTNVENLPEQFGAVIKGIYAKTLAVFSSSDAGKLSTVLLPLKEQDKSVQLKIWERIAAEAVERESRYPEERVVGLRSELHKSLQGVPEESLALFTVSLKKFTIPEDYVSFSAALCFLGGIDARQRTDLLRRTVEEIPSGSNGEDRLRLLKGIYKYSQAHEEILKKLKATISSPENPKDSVDLVVAIGDIPVGYEYMVQERLGPWLKTTRSSKEITTLISEILLERSDSDLQKALDSLSSPSQAEELIEVSVPGDMG